MIRTIFAFACLFAFVSNLNASEPTPAEATVSVLKTSSEAKTTTAPVATTESCACASETFREVTLTAGQARRLARQADRQEARAARECCKCNCDKNCNKKPTALIAERNRCKCDCN